MSACLLSIDTTSQFGSIALVIDEEVAEEVPLHSPDGFGHILFDQIGRLLDRAGTPRDAIETLHRAMVEGLKEAETRQRLADLGVEIVSDSPEEFAAYIRSEIPKWTAVVKSAGVKLE